MIDIKGKKILVTGGNGFIGSAIVKLLLERGAIVNVLDLNDKTDTKHDNLTVDKGSVLNEDVLDVAINDCEYVIHLAAMIGVKNTEDDRLLTLNTNIYGIRNVLDCCITNKIKKIVFSSSSEVYGEQIKQPIEETNSVSPKSAYGITKIVSEEYLKAYKEKYNLDYSVVRYFNAYGPKQKTNFVLPKFVDIVSNYEPITLYGNGSQIRAFCYIDDIANGTYLAFVNENKNFNTFNIGNNTEPISMRDLALKIMKAYGRETELKYLQFRDTDRSKLREIFIRIPDITKAKEILGYEPKVTLEEGIKRTIECREERI